MRQKEDVPSVRRNLALPADFTHQIVRLRTQTESPSGSDIIRRALMCYEEFLEDNEQGRCVGVRELNKKPVTLDLLNIKEHKNCEYIKVNLIFHEGSDRRIDRIRGKIGADTDSEVVRKALKFFDILISEYASGKDIVLCGPNNEVECVRLAGAGVLRKAIGNRPSTTRAKVLEHMD